MPGNALVVTRRTLLSQGLPDSVTVIIEGHDAQVDVIASENSLQVVNHTSRNEYHFSVRGRWLVAGSP